MKTITRIAATGGVILLGVAALAVAQHDARNRHREPFDPPKPASEPAVPIQVARMPSTNEALPSNEALVAAEETGAVVRANNGGLPSVPRSTQLSESTALPKAGWEADDSVENPLRTDASSSMRLADDADVDQEVALAGGTAARAPAGPPVELAAGALPQLPAVAVGAAKASMEQEPGPLPSLPALPQPPGDEPRAAAPMPATVEAPQLEESPTGVPRQGAQGDGGVGGPVAPTFPTGVNMGDTSAGATPRISDSYQLASSRRTLSDPEPEMVAIPAAPGMSGNGSHPPLGAPAGFQRPVGEVGKTHPVPDASGEPVRAGAESTGRPAPVPVEKPMSEPYSVAGNAAGIASSAEAPSSGPMTGLPRTTTASPKRGFSGGDLPDPSDRPGPRQLDGIQNPVLVIEKRAPDESHVGKPASLVLSVRNAGAVPARGVTVVDRVPQGARFVESIPTTSPTADGVLVWELGELPPGDERTITVQVMPVEEGELGSVAAVQFVALASARTVATRPKLQIEMVGPTSTLIGDSHVVNVSVQNLGSGTAESVRLEADLPQIVRHESGDTQLEAVMGDIRPGETKRIALAVSAIAPGSGACVVRAVTDDGILAEQQLGVDVLAPELRAAVMAPRRRYLERQATVNIAVQNSGTAAATNLDFVAHLPAGLKFVSTNNHGAYDPSTHSVTWGLHELPPGQTAPVELTVLPVAIGPQIIRFNARGDLNVSAEAETEIAVDGLSQLAFAISQDNGTVEVGARTTYTVELTNVGNKPDRDVRLAIELPAGSQVDAVQAPVDYQVQGNQLLFAPVAHVAENERLVIRFQVVHGQEGSRVVRAQVTSSNWPVAMVKEIGTLVYNDQR
ncbi:MAG: hypothetical protein KatS3mg111_0999 [Pirellulaceae bacterium]|nr:MAG: hypothetical protein KatS3mg111_0999 [Pirellulaceae bacterium]